MTRHASLDQQKVLFRQNLDDFQILSGSAHVAHMSGHFLILENTTWPLAQTVRSPAAMKHGPVGSRASCEIPTLHHTLKTFALGFRHHVYGADVLEVLQGKDVSLLILVLARETKLLQDLLGFGICLPRVSFLTEIRFIGGFPLWIKSNLQGGISFFLLGFDLQDRTRSGFYDGYGNKVVVLVVHLAHTKLFS